MPASECEEGASAKVLRALGSDSLNRNKELDKNQDGSERDPRYLTGTLVSEHEVEDEDEEDELAHVPESGGETCAHVLGGQEEAAGQGYVEQGHHVGKHEACRDVRAGFLASEVHGEHCYYHDDDQEYRDYAGRFSPPRPGPLNFAGRRNRASRVVLVTSPSVRL